MKYSSFTLLSAALFLLTGCGKSSSEQPPSSAEKVVPLPAVENLLGERDPQADTTAFVGGRFTLWGGPYPKSLNMWSELTSFNATICGLMYESLLELHSTKDEWIGVLAESWSVEDDGRLFTFKLRPEARWSDGTPITAEDIQFYYDVIMDPKNLTPIFKVGLKRLERPEVIDSLTLQVRAKESHWANFSEAAGLIAFPKHAWSGGDFNKRRFSFSPVSGPYAMGELKTNRSLEMKRREEWWGWKRAYNRGKFNFGSLFYRFSEDRTKALEALKKGDWDYYPLYTASIWARQTEFDAVKKGWVVRERIFNDSPVGFQGLVFNMRKSPLNDLAVRRALALLLDRKTMNDQLMFNQYFILDSYYPGLYPNRDNPAVEPTPFNSDSARHLLAEAGWRVDGKGMLRNSSGQPLKISIIHHGEDLRHLEIYLQALRATGVDASIERLSYASVRKRLDEQDFDLFWINWGAGRLQDPEGLWHSSSANVFGSNNLAGFADSIVDRLIEEQKREFDQEKRNQILRQIDLRLLELSPYALLWQNDNHRLLYWNRFGTPQNRLGRFGDPDAAIVYWWVDPVKNEALQRAKKENRSLGEQNGDQHYIAPPEGEEN